MLNDYIIFTSVTTFLFVYYILHRISHPLRCQCGYATIFIGAFKRHILMRHQWQ